MISLATICHHTKLLQYHWLYSSSCTFQPCDSSTQRYWRFFISKSSSPISHIVPNSIPSGSVQLLSHVWLFRTPGSTAPQASLSITTSQSLFKLMSIEPVIPSNNLVLCHPLLHPPSIFPGIRVFPMSQLFTSGGQVLEFQLQHQSFQ